MTNSGLLDANVKFPELALHLITGELLPIPGSEGANYSVVLFYRGYW
jgi:hypothetical protein